MLNYNIQAIHLSTDFFTYNKKTNCFVAEISELPSIPLNLKAGIVLQNPKTQVKKYFKFLNKDMDSTNEDIYGWNFKSDCGIKLLIIND